MWAMLHAFPGLYGIAAGMSTAGALTRWFRDHFARDLPEDEAYRRLQKLSRDRRQTLKQTAEQVLAAADLLG